MRMAAESVLEKRGRDWREGKQRGARKEEDGRTEREGERERCDVRSTAIRQRCNAREGDSKLRAGERCRAKGMK